MSNDEDGSSRVTIRLDGELQDRLEEERDQGPYTIPKAEVIRAALREYFDENPRKCRPA